MNKMYFWLVVMACLCLSSCEFLNLNSDEYYNQQNNEELSQGNISEDIDVHFSEIFEILQPNGVVDKGSIPNAEAYESQLNQLPWIMYENDPSFSLIDFTNTDFNNMLVQATFLQNGNLSVSYDIASLFQWEISTDTYYLPSKNNIEHECTSEYVGSDVMIYTEDIIINMSPVTYYKYDGYNPFYTLESNYNTLTIGESTERGMERFIFYRFVGEMMSGTPAEMKLDTMLMAVDTYTSLLFTYGIPTSLTDFGSPDEWESVESVAQQQGIEARPFFEYDPIGYVNKDYEFLLYAESEVSENNASLIPSFTGVSPYLINVDEENN